MIPMSSTRLGSGSAGTRRGRDAVVEAAISGSNEHPDPKVFELRDGIGGIASRARER